MRKFSSYGPVNQNLHYYAPRKDLIEKAYVHLVGESLDAGGHYMTVWAPRQSGKTWIMHQVLKQLQQNDDFIVIQISLEHLKMQQDVNIIVKTIASEITHALDIKNLTINTLDEFNKLFKSNILKKPLILVLDEFDALAEEAITGLASVFRNIYMQKQYEQNKPIQEQSYLLHAIALIGVKRVLGVENATGSPFNIQRNLHIPNLTFDEVDQIFKSYEKESGQQIDQCVIEQLYEETRGQPGLTCWFGELLTDVYNETLHQQITLQNFENIYTKACHILPNNNILNLISKAKQNPYQQFVLELFKTDEKIKFEYDDSDINFLYMNGVVDQCIEQNNHYVKFASPFVQKRLFNYFSNALFRYTGKLHEPFENLEDTVTEDNINIRQLIKRYTLYLNNNKQWLLKDAPRRADLRIYEAVFHFNLYRYLYDFLSEKGAVLYPEFPTGNGKINLIIKYKHHLYGMELKTFTNKSIYKKALNQAAVYDKK